MLALWKKSDHKPRQGIKKVHQYQKQKVHSDSSKNSLYGSLFGNIIFYQIFLMAGFRGWHKIILLH